MAKKIKSPKELSMLRDWLKNEIDVRSGPKEVQITVHMGTCGIAAGARDILTVLANELTQASAESVALKQAGCAGMCDKEPMITLCDKSGKEFRYGKLDKNKVREIVNEHVIGGRPVANYLIA